MPQNSSSSPFLKDSKDQFLKLSEIIVFLKRQGYPLEGTNVSYYSSIFSAFVNCDIDPVGDFVHIREQDLELIDNTQSLRLRFDKADQPNFKSLNDSDSENAVPDALEAGESDEQSRGDADSKAGNKRLRAQHSSSDLIALN